MEPPKASHNYTRVPDTAIAVRPQMWAVPSSVAIVKHQPFPFPSQRVVWVSSSRAATSLFKSCCLRPGVLRVITVRKHAEFRLTHIVGFVRNRDANRRIAQGQFVDPSKAASVY